MSKHRRKPIPEAALYKAADDHLFVYAFQAEQFFKIGRTRDLEARHLSIAANCPLEVSLRLRLEMPRPDAQLLEIEIHRTLREYYVRREWFEVGLEPVREAFMTALRRAFWPPRQIVPVESNTVWQPRTDRLVSGPPRHLPIERSSPFPLRTDKM